MSKSSQPITIALAGNPNCGKSTLYNRLVKGKANTGNYSRVTVLSQEKTIQYQDSSLTIVDLPGVYSLSSQSTDELEARNYLIHNKPDVIINVLDSGNLERNLFLSTQLIEMGVNIIFVLNMIDEADNKGLEIDTENLAKILKAPVVKTSARTGEGIDELLQTIIKQASKTTPNPHVFIKYDKHLEVAIEDIAQQFSDLHPGQMGKEDARWMAIKMFEGDESVLNEESEHKNLVTLVHKKCDELANQHNETTDMMISDGRYGFINGLLCETVTINRNNCRQQYTHMLDSILLNKYLGIPLFFFIMWLMFEATFTIGAYPMDWIDSAVLWVSDAVEASMPESMTRDLLVNGVIAGVGGTIIFIPNIAMLFLFIALLTETGYLARSAFLVDRIMHSFGLHGKAVIPLVMGFGCNVPAIMATRTIENDKDRLVAILVNPYISCSARFPIFVLFTGAFFPENAGSAMFYVYSTSIFVSLMVAIVLSKFVIKGANETPFIMELPPFRVPSIRSVIVHIGGKVMNFLKKITSVILVGSIIIWFLQSFPQKIELSTDFQSKIVYLQAQSPGVERDKSITKLKNAEHMEILQKRYLGQIGHFFEPVLKPLGFDLNASIALITGIVAKEVVVATFGILYSETDSDEQSIGLREKLKKSLSPLTAVAFMVFTLLYIPCIATIAVMYKETGSLGWTSFSVGFSLLLAWFMAYLVIFFGGLIINW
ncbi:MAG: ferrous iron transport protein B [Pseudomonadota bacterium]